MACCDTFQQKGGEFMADILSFLVSVVAGVVANLISKWLDWYPQQKHMKKPRSANRGFLFWPMAYTIVFAYWQYIAYPKKLQIKPVWKKLMKNDFGAGSAVPLFIIFFYIFLIIFLGAR